MGLEVLYVLSIMNMFRDPSSSRHYQRRGVPEAFW
jgi:hypothetical protein